MTVIYEQISGLLDQAAAGVSEALDDYSYTPSSITIPAVDFATQINSPAVPANPTYMPPPPPTTTLTGSVDRAAYSAVSAVIGSLNIPSLPSSLTYGTPLQPQALPVYDTPADVGLAPESSYITIPDSAGLTRIAPPTIDVGLASELMPIPLLDFTAVGVTKLDIELPAVMPVPSVEELSDPQKLIVLVQPELLTAIQHTLSGQDIMPVQWQMYSLAAHDLRRERADEERKLFAKAADAGFSDSTGMLFEALADINYLAKLKDGETYATGRDALYTAAKNKLEAAVQQAIALETANFAVHMTFAEKLLEVFQINIALHTSLLGLTIELYSAQLEGVNAIISAYNAYIGASLAEHGAELATLDVTRAQLQSNQAKISMYQAQGRTESVRAGVYETAVEQDTLPIEEFTTYIDGLLQNVDIMKLNIAAYKDSLQIQSEAVKIDKASIAAYADQIRASGSALEVYDANWDLYDTAYSAAAQTSNATQQFNSASLQALTGEIGVFRSAAEQQNAYLRAITTWTEERSQIISQYSSTVSQMANYVESKNSSTTSLEEARSRINLAKADNAAIQSALDAQRDAAQAAVDGGLLAATATTMSGAAQAAYSMRSLSASMASSAGDTTSTSGDTSAAESTDYNRSYAYNKTQSLTA